MTLTTRRLFVPVAAVGAAWAVQSAGLGVRAQSDTQKSASAYSAPRTPWGDPDLQGIWTTDQFGQHVDLERPPQLAGRFETSEDEAEKRKEADANQNAYGDTVGNYQRGWRDTEFTKFKPSRRTSLISDPDDGRVPYRKDVQQQLAATRRASRQVESSPRGPEDLPDGLRCLRGFPGVNLPIGYNNNKQVVQSPTHITILYEMNHDMRVIPLKDTSPVNPHLKLGWGVPRGHWEGDTLVIETTNFTGELAFQGSRENLKVTERFRRTATVELDYKFTVEDPTVYERPWTVWMPWLRDDSQYEVFEYACHEGNYSLVDVLKGAAFEARRASR